MITVGFILAYLLGSIPSAIWIGKAVHGRDVRTQGSGNAGATNTFRVFGVKTGTLVMLADTGKAVIAVLLVDWLTISTEGDQYIWLQLGYGLTCVAGHIYPVFAGFKGGKGVASMLGMVVALHWPLAVCCIAIFIAVLFTSRYVSLSSIIAVCSFPVLAYFVFGAEKPVWYFGLFASLLVLYTHRQNIERLRSGTENKVTLHKSSKE